MLAFYMQIKRCPFWELAINIALSAAGFPYVVIAYEHVALNAILFVIFLKMT